MFRTLTILACLLLALAGCSDDPPDKGNNGGTNNGMTDGGAADGGTDGGGADSGPDDVGGEDVGDDAGMDADDPDASGDMESDGGTPMGGKLDLLWVMDNSGSMCQEQKVIQDNIQSFIEELAATSVDFHIAITTTHMNDSFSFEPVAEPGHLQSTPQPIVGFDRSCHLAQDASGDPIDGDYSPIRDIIEVAVSCMQTPDASVYQWSNADIECALYNSPPNCEISGVCGGTGTACLPEDLFPPPSSFRSIPLVLKSDDYTDPNGALDVSALVDDFTCASLVGTRGFGVEQPLAAAVRAVHPDLTGGAVGTSGADTTKPNHGFIRTDASFGLMVVSDENDCSHDGTLDVNTACADMVCDFENDPGVSNSSLVDLSQLKSDLASNLAATRGTSSVADSEIFVASIHGTPNRYMGAYATNAQCADTCNPGQCPTGMVCDESGTSSGRCVVESVCESSLGAAESGDRYERFLDLFPDENTFPAPGSSEDRTGWICNMNGDFSSAITQAGQAISLFAATQ